MHVEFQQVVLPDDLRRLVAFDRRVFGPSDRFTAVDWRELESYWMLVEGRRVGCCAFQRDVDVARDAYSDNPSCAGSLYIASTAILPRYQSMGFGRLLKSWQIAYARFYGFRRVVTNHRRSNRRIIQLNKEFGFRTAGTIPRYYRNPEEPAVILELRLRRHPQKPLRSPAVS